MFVSRDGSGNVTGVFMRPQPGTAEEGLPDDHADVVGFLSPPVDLRAYAVDKRWRVEIGGTTVNGILVPTDDSAKLKLLGAAMTLADNASTPLVIRGVSYGVMSGAQIKALNAAVINHVQATFPVLAAVLASIEAGTIATTAQIDAAGWPPNG